MQWVQSNKELHAAILQGVPDVGQWVKASEEKLEAFLAAIRANQKEARARLRQHTLARRAPRDGED